MNSLTVKILTGLLSVLIITTIGSQIYSALTERHDTEEAVLVTINEDMRFARNGDRAGVGRLEKVQAAQQCSLA